MSRNNASCRAHGNIFYSIMTERSLPGDEKNTEYKVMSYWDLVPSLPFIYYLTVAVTSISELFIPHLKVIKSAFGHRYEFG